MNPKPPHPGQKPSTPPAHPPPRKQPARKLFVPDSKPLDGSAPVLAKLRRPVRRSGLWLGLAAAALISLPSLAQNTNAPDPGANRLAQTNAPDPGVDTLADTNASAPEDNSLAETNAPAPEVNSPAETNASAPEVTSPAETNAPDPGIPTNSQPADTNAPDVAISAPTTGLAPAVNSPAETNASAPAVNSPAETNASAPGVNSPAETRQSRTRQSSDTNVKQQKRPQNPNPTTSTPQTTDLSSFKIISERNIFDPNRGPRRTSNPDREKPRSIESFSLVGVMAYEKGTFAFFDGTSGNFRKAAKSGDEIAGFKLAAIQGSSVKLKAKDKDYDLQVGMQLRREDQGEWRLSKGTETYNPASAPQTSSSSQAPATTASSAPSDEVLKRLMQRREQE